MEKKPNIEEKIINVLIEKGPLTRSEICRLLDLPRTTVYDYLMRLSLKGKVTRFEELRKTKGRPRVFWAANIGDERE